MPNLHLPQEILEYIVDLLHDKPETLKRCCIVSKSWVSCTRKHLFANIRLHSAGNLESWKKTFPDCKISPARYARTLFVGCPRLIVAADAEEGGWIQAFCGVARLEVGSDNGYIKASQVSLTPFHKFSSTLKSLHVCPILLPYPQLLDLVCSFPLLENLTLAGHQLSSDGEGDTKGPQTIAPSASPPLTGALDLYVLGGLGKIACQLLDLPNGIRFRKLTFSWDHKEDLRWMTQVVARCSHTLEYLDVAYDFRRTSIRIYIPINNLILFPVGPESTSLDLSEATKLRDAVFRPGSVCVEWITTALQTITPEHRELRQISIYVPHHLTRYNVGADIRQSLGETTFGRWADLDRLLVQFWESCSIRPRVGCVKLGEKGKNIGYSVGRLLPEITKRGIVEPV